ncbi:MAG: 2-oxoglutarate dehydrogenase, E2 component, dihydrolipoamide succinyltransferase [Rhodothermales bacterium]|nr:2-oxoglutarate dehydrogenase, E2 component, dihydrolipoamide succinyltransferase [Rhodothermales bacterium]MBO6780912.1 2-oxoglutarate dehydrogenase, E2 component, dihydrolipoamide succinyltransferase [Rhodothermales bacterium]
MAKIDVTMPKMGESITEGTVIVWLKKPGEAVELDEPLLEIGTDKVDTEVPSPAAGVLAEILVEEGETVEVNSVIARLETDAEAAVSDAPSEAPPAAAAEPEPAAAAPAAEPAAAPSSGGAAVATMAAGEPVQVVMPKMGESIMEGTIITWAKQPGDSIELDETLLEIATDKVDTEVPSPAAGVVVQLLHEEGATVEVGAPIAIIATGDGAAVAPAAPQAPAAPAQAPATPAPTPAPSGDGTAGPIPRHDDEGSFYTPLVRSIAEKEGVSLAQLKTIQGSGRDGRVTKADLMGYLRNRSTTPAPTPAAPAAAPAAPTPSRPAPAPVVATGDGRVEIIKMDRMRQIIADHMTRSKATSAHVTSFAEIDVTNLVRLRESEKAGFMQREGVKLTYTPFFVHAAIDALKDHPLMNGSVQEKEIVVKKDFHIGIAVAIAKTGLVVPVIRYAGQKNIAGLAHAAADLAARARSKQLQPEELQGGTFTVTNVGSLGSIMGTPIINQPQVAILAPGAITKRPVVIEDPNIGDVIGIRHMMYVSLSYDHRIIDGAMAASFLQRYREALEGFSPGYEL